MLLLGTAAWALVRVATRNGGLGRVQYLHAPVCSGGRAGRGAGKCHSRGHAAAVQHHVLRRRSGRPCGRVTSGFLAQCSVIYY